MGRATAGSALSLILVFFAFAWAIPTPANARACRGNPIAWCDYSSSVPIATSGSVQIVLEATCGVTLLAVAGPLMHLAALSL